MSVSSPVANVHSSKNELPLYSLTRVAELDLSMIECSIDALRGWTWPRTGALSDALRARRVEVRIVAGTRSVD